MPFSQKHRRTFRCNFCARIFSTQKRANIHTSTSSCSKGQAIQPAQQSPEPLPVPPSSAPPPQTSEEGIHKVVYPDAARVIGYANTALDDFDEDKYSHERVDNLYYPWSSREEWQLARFVLRSSMSTAEIDEYLKLELTKRSFLSFKTSSKLIETAWLLPKVPSWKSIPIPTDNLYPTKAPMYLFYRDAIEVLQHIMKSPLVQDYLHFEPLKIFKTADKIMRVYNSWLSSDRAWKMQGYLPKGGTLIGTILSSDKTSISVISGNRSAWPLLISLANIDSDLLSKASHNLFQLLALIPIPHFIHPEAGVRTVLESRVYHQCMDIATGPLKIAASIGHLMADPVGQVRLAYTVLAADIVDTPEATLIACVGGAGKTSPFTTAVYYDYGDAHRHPPRLGNATLKAIDDSVAQGNPDDLPKYVRVLHKYRTNGVINPFWRDWALAEPCEFLTPEALHHWWKMFWDHDVVWCINAVGAAEVDLRFRLLPHRQGFRHFSKGISQLEQVTGRGHREVMRYLVGVIAGAVSQRFVLAIRALNDFRYAGQAPSFTDGTTARLQLALDEFHGAKQAILDSKARLGSTGELLNHWEIPKLEFMQSVCPSIKASGPVMQWSAEPTEHAHITEIKEPAARAGNNKNLEEQICRCLDLQARLRDFDLMTAMRDANVDFRITETPSKSSDNGKPLDIDNNSQENTDEEGDGGVDCTTTVDSTSDLRKMLETTLISKKIWGAARPKQDFFRRSEFIKANPRSPQPYRTFTDSSGSCAAMNVTRNPDLKSLSIDDAATKFKLPGLRGALFDYLELVFNGTATFHVGETR